MSMHESIFTHARMRYLWMALILLVASSIAYFWHEPIGVPNGGTWLGYTLGTIAAVLILWLMWFGIRKRRYSSSIGTLRGWLSGHVYLGTSLLLITLLHSGFQLGYNIHTLALVLMVIVIFSGFFGVYAYMRYPGLMTRNRDSASRQAIIDEIHDIDQNSLQFADAVDPKIHATILRSIERTRLGGGVRSLLFPRDDSDSALDQVREYLDKRDAERRPGAQTRDMPTMFAMVDFLAASSGGADNKNVHLRKLMDLLARKKSLTGRLSRDLQLQALMEIWLFIHVPLSFALLAALTAHIVSVFFYW
jgi:hypothetical protein